MKAARAMVGATPGLGDTLQSDWRKAALFYARFGITEGTFRQGVLADDTASESLTDRILQPMNAISEVSEHARAVFISYEAA